MLNPDTRLVFIITGGGVGSSRQPVRQDHEGDVRAETERGQQRDAVAAGAELVPDDDAPAPAAAAVRLGVGLLPVEELAVALVAAEDGDEHDGGAVDGEEGADGVELGREDLEDDQSERELRQRRPHVRPLEGALGGADLDQPSCIFSMPAVGKDALLAAA